MKRTLKRELKQDLKSLKGVAIQTISKVQRFNSVSGSRIKIPPYTSCCIPIIRSKRAGCRNICFSEENCKSHLLEVIANIQ